MEILSFDCIWGKKYKEEESVLYIQAASIFNW